MTPEAGPRGVQCVGLMLALLLPVPALPGQESGESSDSSRSAGQQGPRLTVALRYDDWWATGASSERKADIDRRVLAIAREHGAPLTVALVPAFPARGAKGTLAYAPLRRGDPLIEPLIAASRAGAAEVALHGLHHTSPVPGGRVIYPFEGFAADPKYHHYSEFGREPAQEQARWMSEGLALFAEAGLPRPTVFVPPFNGYDDATYRLCAENGMTVLSADLRQPVPASRNGVRLIPSTLEWRHSRRLDKLLALMDAMKDRQAVAVFLCHYHDFTESGLPEAVSPLADFDRFVGRVSSDPRIRLASLAELPATEGAAFTVERYRAATTFRRRVMDLDAVHIVPYRFLPDPSVVLVYWSQATYEALNRRTLLLLGVTFGLLSGCGLAASAVLVVLLRRHPRALAACLVAMAALGAAYALTRVRASGECLAAFALGFAVPLAVLAVARRGRAAGATPGVSSGTPEAASEGSGHG